MSPGYPITLEDNETTGGDDPWDRQSRVGHMMSRPLVTIDEDSTLRAAAEMMVEESVGALLLAPESPPRIITEQDIVTALADGTDPDSATVADVASTDLICADEDDTVADVIEMMSDYAIRHVPVRWGGKIVGMISARDIVRGLSPTGDLSEYSADTAFFSPFSVPGARAV